MVGAAEQLAFAFLLLGGTVCLAGRTDVPDLLSSVNTAVQFTYFVAL